MARPLFREGHPKDVEIKHVPAFRGAAVRHTGPYNQVGEAFDRLGVSLVPPG
ncbi:MAG: hypothetical protein ABI969_12605 [bacterium]